MRKTAEMDPGFKRPVDINDSSVSIIQFGERVRPTPTTREEKKEIVREAYSEGYFRALPKERQLLLGVRYLEFASDRSISQENLALFFGVNTRAGVSYMEQQAIRELDQYKRFIEGEEVDERWKRSLIDNREALSYLYSKFRTKRFLARILGVRDKDMVGILRSHGINVHPGHPSLDLQKLFGDDPKQEIARLRRLGYSIKKIAHSAGISERTMKKVIKRLD